MRQFYLAFCHEQGKTVSLAQRVEICRSAVAYFTNSIKPSSDNECLTPDFTDCTNRNPITSNLLQITLQSLEKLLAWEKEEFGSKTFDTLSFVSTNIVENFFSKIRAKVRYPSAWDYAVLHEAQYEELVKMLAKDSLLPQFSKSAGKAYGNIDGLSFIMADLRWCSRKERAAAIKETYEKNCGKTKETHRAGEEYCLEISGRLPPTRRFLSTREATCKKRPGLRTQLLLCPGCPKMYVYPASYKKHIEEKHRTH